MWYNSSTFMLEEVGLKQYVLSWSTVCCTLFKIVKTDLDYRLETKAGFSKTVLPLQADNRKILREIKRDVKSRHNMATTKSL